MSVNVSPRCAAALLALLASGSAQAHDAFGDLGPFYGGLLHPLVDPGQGLLLAAMAVLLARQPIRHVRGAFLALLVGVTLAQVVHAILQPLPGIGTQAVGPIVAVLGLLALIGLTLPAPATGLLAGGLAGLAGLSTDIPDGPRAALLAAGGGALGIALFVLLIWNAIDLLQARLGRIAGAVAGSWILAIGIMATALPSVADDTQRASDLPTPAAIRSPDASIGSPGPITRAEHDP